MNLKNRNKKNIDK